MSKLTVTATDGSVQTVHVSGKDEQDLLARARDIRVVRPLIDDLYERIDTVTLSEPEHLKPIDPKVIAESLRVFRGWEGQEVVTAQLCTYGAAWRFWVVQ